MIRGASSSLLLLSLLMSTLTAQEATNNARAEQFYAAQLRLTDKDRAQVYVAIVKAGDDSAREKIIDAVIDGKFPERSTSDPAVITASTSTAQQVSAPSDSNGWANLYARRYQPLSVWYDELVVLSRGDSTEAFVKGVIRKFADLAFKSHEPFEVLRNKAPGRNLAVSYKGRWIPIRSTAEWEDVFIQQAETELQILDGEQQLDKLPPQFRKMAIIGRLFEFEQLGDKATSPLNPFHADWGKVSTPPDRTPPATEGQLLRAGNAGNSLPGYANFSPFSIPPAYRFGFYNPGRNPNWYGSAGPWNWTSASSRWHR